MTLVLLEEPAAKENVPRLTGKVCTPFDADRRPKLRECDQQIPPEEHAGMGIYEEAVGSAMPWAQEDTQS